MNKIEIEKCADGFIVKVLYGLNTHDCHWTTKLFTSKLKLIRFLRDLIKDSEAQEVVINSLNS